MYNTNQFKNLLAFLILMGNEQILGRSPDYILEKLSRYAGEVNTPDTDEWRWGLDSNNQRLFDDYLTLWVNRQEDSHVAGSR